MLLLHLQEQVSERTRQLAAYYASPVGGGHQLVAGTCWQLTHVRVHITDACVALVTDQAALLDSERGQANRPTRSTQVQRF